MKIDVFQGRNFRPHFEHVSPRRNERADERRRVEVAAGQREDDRAALDRGARVEAACRLQVRGAGSPATRAIMRPVVRRWRKAVGRSSARSRV